MSGVLRAGIIGCGGIAHAHLDGYRENGVAVTALADVNTQAAAALAAKVKGEVKCFAGCRELVDSGLVEVVSICSPPASHEAAAVYALTRGIHVLCEKPLAHDAASAARIAAAAAAGKALLMPAFRHRFLPALVRIKQELDAGAIGTPVFFQNVFCGPAFDMKDRWFTRKAIAGGGCLFDTNSHSVDLFRMLLGEIVEQRAVTHQHFPGTDVEDAGILVVKSAEGVLGTMTSTFVAGVGQAFISIMGQKGEIAYDYFVPEVIKLRRADQPEAQVIKTVASGGFVEQIAHLLGAIRGEHPLSCTVADGRRAVEIIQSVY